MGRFTARRPHRLVSRIRSGREAARRRAPRPRPARERCSFRGPEVLFVSNSGFDVRRMVVGRWDPWDLYRRCQTDRGLAQKIGCAIGKVLIEQHTRVVEAARGFREDSRPGASRARLP
jgi:hypothetical protein